MNKFIKCNFGGKRCGTSTIVDFRRLKVNRGAAYYCVVFLTASARLPPREWPLNALNLVVPGDSVDTVFSREQFNACISNNHSVFLLIQKGNFSFSKSLESGVIDFDYLSTDILTPNIINRFFLGTSNSNPSSLVFIVQDFPPAC